MNDNMRNSRISLILSIISFAGVLSVWILWVFGVFRVSVIDLGTFVGIIVALLAIIVTVVLGLQIINALDIREKITELEQKHTALLEIDRQLNENSISIVKLAHNLQAGICDSGTNLYVASGQFIEAFGSCHSAFYNAILSGQGGLQSRLQQLQALCEQSVRAPQVDFSIIRKQIEIESQQIKETEAYRVYLSVGYDQIMAMFWQRMVYLGLLK